MITLEQLAVLDPRLARRISVSDADCWEYRGNLVGGYPQITRNAQPGIRGHRYVWALFNGQIPAGQCVLHRCDNRRSVNPAHLSLGTRKDNIEDMIAKGRRVKPPVKITDEQVAEVRSMVERRFAHREIAQVFGVSPSLVSMIRSGQRRAS